MKVAKISAKSKMKTMLGRHQVSIQKYLSVSKILTIVNRLLIYIGVTNT